MNDPDKFRSDAQWALVAKILLGCIAAYVLYQVGMTLWVILLLRSFH